MRYVWFPLALFCACALHVILFFENVVKIFYNLFHKTKKAISWSLMDYGPDEMDITEKFYHD